MRYSREVQQFRARGEPPGQAGNRAAWWRSLFVDERCGERSTTYGTTVTGQRPAFTSRIAT
ncbi:hypothetical protein, partial [Streptomyces chiangmaiensis]